MFRVSAFAAAAGVTPKVLRDYDELALFRPAWVDPGSGYRFYSPAQLPQLRRIVALRHLGVGLDEIRRLVDARSDLRVVLERRRAELIRQQELIERQLALLGVQVDDPDGDVVVRTVPPQRVAVLDVTETNGDVERAFYQLEKLVQAARARRPQPPGLIDGVRPRDRQVFVPIRPHRPGAFKIATLPAVRAATILHVGSYDTLPATKRRLSSWLKAAGFSEVGARRVVYLRFGAEADLKLGSDYLATATEDQLTELQAPIAGE